MIPSTDEDAITCGNNCPHHKECLYTMMGVCNFLGPQTARDLHYACGLLEEPPDSLFPQASDFGQAGGMTACGKSTSAFGSDFWRRMGVSEEYASRELPILKKWLDAYRWSLLYNRLGGSRVTLH